MIYEDFIEGEYAMQWPPRLRPLVSAPSRGVGGNFNWLLLIIFSRSCTSLMKISFKVSFSLTSSRLPGAAHSLISKHVAEETNKTRLDQTNVLSFSLPRKYLHSAAGRVKNTKPSTSAVGKLWKTSRATRRQKSFQFESKVEIFDVKKSQFRGQISKGPEHH